MNHRNWLVISRACNNIGDLFYYFVITIVFYGLNPSPIMLGALSMSYLLPGIFFSYVVNVWTKNMGSRKILVISDTIRAVCIGLMSIAYNAYFLLILVFVEQCLSISSSVAFDQYVAFTQKKSDMGKINGAIGFFTNFVRLTIVPIYLSVSPILGDRFFIVIDAIFTALAIILLRSIPESDGDYKRAQGPGITLQKNARMKLTIYHLAIVIFCLMCTERVAIDSYAIVLSDEKWGNGKIIFSYITFVTTVALLISSALATKKQVKRLFTNGKLMTVAGMFLTIVACYTITNNKYIFVIFIGLSYFIVNYYQTLMISSIQQEVPELVSALMLFLTFIYNAISLSFVGFGAIIAEKSSIVLFFRVLFMVLIVLFAIVFFILKKFYRKSD